MRMAQILLSTTLLIATCTAPLDAEQTTDCKPIEAINNGVCRDKEGNDCKEREFKLSPKLCEAPDPEYTSEAAKADVKGTVVLRYTLGVDGCAHDIQVVHGVGFGLDEAAVAALELWRWQRRNKPMSATVEMNFAPETSSKQPPTGSKCADVSRQPVRSLSAHDR